MLWTTRWPSARRAGTVLRTTRRLGHRSSPGPREPEASLLRTVVDLVPAMIGYWDRDLRNRFANAAYLEWFGLTPEQMLGMHIREVLGDELFARNLPYLTAALEGTEQQFDRTIVDAAGATRHSQAVYRPDLGPDGDVRGFSVLVSDVTERVLAERRLAEEQDRVARLSDKLRVVGALSASLSELDPDGLQDAVADAVLALGFEGSIIVLRDPQGLLRPRHGRGIFSVLDGVTVARTSTVTGDVVRDGELRHIDDYQHYAHALPAVRATNVRSVTAVPIRSGTEVIGVLQAGRSTVQPLADDDREVLSLLAAVAGTNLRHARSFVGLQQDHERLAEQVVQDPLTSLGNRRAAEELLAGVRPGDALVVLDLDHFKRVNDEHGHAAGDVVLRGLGRLLLTQLRQRDRATRVGGEEFLLFLPSTSPDEARSLVERLREQWSDAGSTTTFSAGVAVVEEGESGQRAQDRADTALYAAKAAGRDRTLLAEALDR